LGTPLLINQFRYNMLAREPEKDNLFYTLETIGAGSIAFCPLAQGLLTSRYLDGIPEGSRATHSVFLKKENITEDVLNKVRALNDIAQNRGQTIAEMALSWNLRKDRLTSVLIGASKEEQIRENVKVIAKMDFTDEELSDIDKILA